MVKSILTALMVILAFTGFSQSKDGLNISVWAPPSWLSGDKNLLHENIQHYKFSKSQVEQLKGEINASNLLGMYYKYDPQIHYGLVPTVKVYIKQYRESNFAEFFAVRKKEIESVKTQILNFKYVENPRVVIVDERKAFYATATYNIKVQTGELASVRTKFICVPIKDQYLYVTLLDNEEDDCSKVFDTIINKIKIE